MERSIAPVDTEAFLSLCSAAEHAGDPAQRRKLYSDAFSHLPTRIPKVSPLPRSHPCCGPFHRGAEAVLSGQPVSESVYQSLMSGYLAFDERENAMNTFEALVSGLFLSDGSLPSEDSLRLYQSACCQQPDQPVPQKSLREPAGPDHGIVCDYDFFRMLYQLEARWTENCSGPTQVVLLSLVGEDDSPLSPADKDAAVRQLLVDAASCLRPGDVISQCSRSQLLLMLTQTSLEDGNKVCQQILEVFSPQGVSTPVQVHNSIFSLTQTP